jgi:ADP-ribose pyrophosphatase
MFFKVFFLFFMISISAYEKDLIAPYLKFLKENEDVLGEVGSYKEGKIEIVLDPKRISQIQELQKARSIKAGMSEEASEIGARVGVIAEDLYWVFLRDAVIFPTGAEGTYNRLIWKSSLDKGPPGVAILPLLDDKKIAAIVAYRHATRCFELEIPRGVRATHEEVEAALKRELEEETGFLSKENIFLGNMAPDPGMASTVTSVYLAKVNKEGYANQDYSEAILGVRLFTVKEIKKALVEGYLDLEIKGRKQKVYVRDSYLTFALLLAESKGII